MIIPNYDVLCLLPCKQDFHVLNPAWSPGWSKESHGSQIWGPRRRNSQEAVTQKTDECLLICYRPGEREAAGWTRITGALRMRRWQVCTGAMKRPELSSQFSVSLSFMRLSETVIETAKCMGLWQSTYSGVQTRCLTLEAPISHVLRLGSPRAPSPWETTRERRNLHISS